MQKIPPNCAWICRPKPWLKLLLPVQRKIEYTRTATTLIVNKKEHPGRTKLPEHLERRQTIIEPAEDISLCKKIAEEITEQPEYEAGKL